MPTAKLTYYNHNRGFGFLGQKPGGPFVHVTAFIKAGIDPVEGEMYSYRLSNGLDGRERAVDLDVSDGFLDV